MGKSNFDIPLNSEIVQDIINISKEIENEKENIEPDNKKISQLMYQQLIKGMYLNTVYNRTYNIY